MRKRYSNAHERRKNVKENLSALCAGLLMVVMTGGMILYYFLFGYPL